MGVTFWSVDHMSIKVRIELRRLKVLKEKKNKSRGIFSAFLFLNSAIGLLLSVDFEIQKANFKANNFCMNMKTNKKCKYFGSPEGNRTPDSAVRGRRLDRLTNQPQLPFS